jgi:reactive intermediate/imine deaminase
MEAFILPGMPHPLLCPDANPGYQRLRDAYDKVRARIEEIQPDVILLYSTQWTSIIGHQVQGDPAPKWTHVDPEWHELGSIDYQFKMDTKLGEEFVAAGKARGLEMRAVNVHGFPMDTGTITALKLINPDNKFAANVVSCNLYADRQETLVLGKAARDALQGKKAVVVAVTNLSNRVHSTIIPFSDDKIHSLKDDEWNRKYLEFLGEGRLEDASQLAREFTRQAGGDQRMKAIWWLSAVMGQTNELDGELLAYEPVYGKGCAVVSLSPSTSSTLEAEFDEDDAETYQGDRNVLGGVNAFEGPAATEASQSSPVTGAPGINASAAPKPVGAYPHARQVGNLLYLSGIGPRNPADNSVPGGPIRDAAGNPQEYDVRAQTEAVIANMKIILAASGKTLADIVDVTCFLVNMDRDFAGFNEVYAKHFADVGATRTTLSIVALPTPIAVEFKAIAQ